MTAQAHREGMRWNPATARVLGATLFAWEREQHPLLVATYSEDHVAPPSPAGATPSRGSLSEQPRTEITRRAEPLSGSRSRRLPDSQRLYLMQASDSDEVLAHYGAS